MNVAFVPLRGGSKSIPLKNIKGIYGRPLAYWALKAAQECNSIDKIYVSTDSSIIEETVESFSMSKVQVVGRSTDTASDTASTESAMLEFANNYDFDNIVLIQATSPLITSEDLDGGFELFNQNDTDSVLSVVRQKRFHWVINQNGFAVPANYDPFHRPRRQDFNGYLVENGAFYMTSKSRLQKYKNRISGNIKTFEMDEDSFFEIDEPSDWILVEGLMKKKKKAKFKIPRIKLLATDCDGVLTDAGMYYSEKGDEIKKFNTLDGMGFELLRKQGIKTAIITAENNPLIIKRGTKVKADDILLGVRNKLEALTELCNKYEISLDEAAYIGDDIFDVPAICACGLGCAPASAISHIKEKADYVANKCGGEGCFREIADLILEVQ